MGTGVLGYHVPYRRVQSLQGKPKTKRACTSTQLKASALLAEAGNICSAYLNH